MNPGFYWVQFKGTDAWTIGEYDPEFSNSRPWQVIGSDEIFEEGQIEVAHRITDYGSTGADGGNQPPAPANKRREL